MKDKIARAIETGTYQFRDSRLFGQINVRNMHIISEEEIEAEEARAEADQYGPIIPEKETKANTISVSSLMLGDRPTKPRKEASAAFEMLVYAFAESEDKSATALAIADEFRESGDVTMAAAFAAMAPKIALGDLEGVKEEIVKISQAM